MRAFTAVAQEGGFAKAAAKLGVTQPAVTLQVRGLEDAYGVVLFDRRGAEVALTPIGRELFALTRQIRNLEDEVDDLLNAQHDLVSGSLTVAASSPQIAMDLVGRFRKRHPQCRTAVLIGNHHFVWEEVLERRADIAVNTNVPDDKRVLALPFCQNEIVLLVPRAHALARRKSVRVKEIAEAPLILRSDRSKTQQEVEKLFREAGLPLYPDMMVGSREAVREAVAAGLGLGFVFEMEVGQDRRVCAVKIAQKRERNTEYVFCLKAQSRRRLVQAFLDTVAECQAPEFRGQHSVRGAAAGA